MSDRARFIDNVAVGQLLLGKYRVESILGLGGMGVVAQCMHIALNERVAIKMMRQDVTADPGSIERFIREAQAAAKLKSEYVARVSDVGNFEDGTHYMVMEYLEGHDLGKLLEQRGRLPAGWASELVLQAAEALSEAHSLGIVHRDVKPTNLFVTWRPDGTALIKVLDFGVSKVYGSAELRLTNTQSLLGTPVYMSPEQMRSARNVDPRTDIWALGVVLYELVEGYRPFDAESFTELCVKVSIDPPQPMVSAPAELQRIVMRCLEKDPVRRYASMWDLGCELLPFAKNEKEAVMIVERMERMRRRPRAISTPSGGDVAPPAPETPPANARLPDKRWPDVTPTTERDTNVVQLVDQAIERASESSPITPSGETNVRALDAIDAAAVAPATSTVLSVAERPGDREARGEVRARTVPVPAAKPPAAADDTATEHDTIFEVGSTHVPFSDRRADDLAQGQLPPLPRLPPLPPPAVRDQRPVSRPSPVVRQHASHSGWKLAVLLIVTMMLVGAALGYYL